MINLILNDKLIIRELRNWQPNTPNEPPPTTPDEKEPDKKKEPEKVPTEENN